MKQLDRCVTMDGCTAAYYTDTQLLLLLVLHTILDLILLRRAWTYSVYDKHKLVMNIFIFIFYIK